MTFTWHCVPGRSGMIFGAFWAPHFKRLYQKNPKKISTNKFAKLPKKTVYTRVDPNDFIGEMKRKWVGGSFSSFW